MTNLTLHLRESLDKATHSFVFLHGYDCSGHWDVSHWQSWCHGNKVPYRGLRVVCPDAPLQKTSAPGYGDKPVHSWYDFHYGECDSADDGPDLKTLRQSCDEIHKIIENEAKIVGDISRVYVGGVSQGCGAALHAVSTLPHGKIGGFYGSIGHVLPTTNVKSLSEKIDGPILFFNGANDDVMSWSWVRETFIRLQDVPNVEIWREDGVAHEDDGHWISNFLCRVMPPPSLSEQLASL